MAGRPRDGSCDDAAWGPLRGEAAPQLWLTPTWALLGGTDPDQAVANDGVVTASSARWGTFLGCIPVDHIEVVGVRGISMQTPEAVEFDQGAFVVEYVDRLRAIEQGAHPSVMTASVPRSLPRTTPTVTDEVPFVASR